MVNKDVALPSVLVSKMSSSPAVAANALNTTDANSQIEIPAKSTGKKIPGSRGGTAESRTSVSPRKVLRAIAKAFHIKAKSLSISRPGTVQAASATAGPAPEFADEFPEPEISPHSFVVHGKIRGKFVRILVDTGCNTMLISDKWIRRHRFQTYEPATAINVEWGDGEGIFTSTRMLPTSGVKEVRCTHGIVFPLSSRHCVWMLSWVFHSSYPWWISVSFQIWINGRV